MAHSKTKSDRREYSREYYLNHKSGISKKVKDWRRDNPERRRANVRRGELKRKYNITPEEYDEMLEKQGGVCDICRKVCRSGRRLAVDHCHSSGKVRGLLCARCNTSIGGLEEEYPRLFLAAIEYLQRHHKPSRETLDVTIDQGITN